MFQLKNVVFFNGIKKILYFNKRIKMKIFTKRGEKISRVTDMKLFFKGAFPNGIWRICIVSGVEVLRQCGIEEIARNRNINVESKFSRQEHVTFLKGEGKLKWNMPHALPTDFREY